MDGKFRCNICGISFPSWSDMKKHFQSKEHKDKASMGNAELLMEKFLKYFKEPNNGSNKI